MVALQFVLLEKSRMDARKALTGTEYRAERAALVAMFLDIRSGRYGAKTEMYLYGARTAAATLRRAYWKRGNAPYRGR